MKKYLLLLIIPAIAIVFIPEKALATIDTFNSSGSTSWEAPAGVTSIDVACWGGGGGGADGSGSDTGGGGGGGDGASAGGAGGTYAGGGGGGKETNDGGAGADGACEITYTASSESVVAIKGGTLNLKGGTLQIK